MCACVLFFYFNVVCQFQFEHLDFHLILHRFMPQQQTHYEDKSNYWINIIMNIYFTTESGTKDIIHVSNHNTFEIHHRRICYRALFRSSAHIVFGYAYPMNSRKFASKDRKILPNCGKYELFYVSINVLWHFPMECYCDYCLK